MTIGFGGKTVLVECPSVLMCFARALRTCPRTRERRQCFKASDAQESATHKLLQALADFRATKKTLGSNCRLEQISQLLSGF
jgi:hypothetical protein